MAYNYTNPFAPNSTTGQGLYGSFTVPSFYPPVQQPTNDLIFVLDESAARSYPVGNGQKVTLWDKNYPKFYIKSVDQNGIPSFRKFSFIEETEQPVIETPKTVTDDYITKADMDEYANKIVERVMANLHQTNNAYRKPNKENK